MKVLTSAVLLLLKQLIFKRCVTNAPSKLLRTASTYAANKIKFNKRIN